VATIEQHFGKDLIKLKKAEIVEILVPYRPQLVSTRQWREGKLKKTKRQLLSECEHIAQRGFKPIF
jgi:hypothetical protein